MSDPARWRDLAVAGHLGDAATARSALADHDPHARQLALGALERAGALADDDVIHALADPEASVRRRAAELAASRPAVPLLHALADDDPTVAEVAAWALGEQAQAAGGTAAETVDALVVAATGAGDALVREAAVAALGAIGDPRGLPAILAGCRDKPAVRRRAVLALAPFDGPEVDAALAAALDDRDWQVRQAAEDVGGVGAGSGSPPAENS